MVFEGILSNFVSVLYSFFVLILTLSSLFIFLMALHHLTTGLSCWALCSLQESSLTLPVGFCLSSHLCLPGTSECSQYWCNVTYVFLIITALCQVAPWKPHGLMEHWDEGYNTQKLLSITKKKQKSKEPSKNRSIVLHMWNGYEIHNCCYICDALPWKSCSFRVNGKVGEEKFIWNERGSWNSRCGW